MNRRSLTLALAGGSCAYAADAVVFGKLAHLIADPLLIRLPCVTAIPIKLPVRRNEPGMVLS